MMIVLSMTEFYSLVTHFKFVVQLSSVQSYKCYSAPITISARVKCKTNLTSLYIGLVTWTAILTGDN